MSLLVEKLYAEYSYLYEAEDERTLSDGGLAFNMLVWYTQQIAALFPLTQQYELELREPSAAWAATLLHALGHDWAWRVILVFAMSRVMR
jgi:hypothetical protein